MNNPPSIEQLKVLLKIPSGKTKEGQILLKIFTQNERLRRTLMTLIGFWLLSLFCILIPVAHFLLVPVFFLLSPFLALKKWQQDASIIGGECLCPECSEKIVLGSLTAHWPLTLTCMNCKARVSVEKI